MSASCAKGGVEESSAGHTSPMSDDFEAIRARPLVGDGGGEFGQHADLTQLLAARRSSPISVWVDPVSTATNLFLPYLDID